MTIAGVGLEFFLMCPLHLKVHRQRKTTISVPTAAVAASDAARGVPFVILVALTAASANREAAVAAVAAMAAASAHTGP